MNKDNYKKALDEIHASNELKNKTFEKIKNRPNKKLYLKYLTTIAAVFVICLVGIISLDINKQITHNSSDDSQTTEIATVKDDLPRFNSMEELKDVLKDSPTSMSKSRGLYTDSVNQELSLETAEAKTEEDMTKSTSDTNYSTTNVQVENVDEADIVKTDGEYIYYLTGNNIYIVKANELEIITKIEFGANEQTAFSPTEIYINKDMLIVLGNYYEYETINTKIKVNEDVSTDEAIARDYVSVRNKSAAKAIVYDISNKENPNIVREVSLDGYYINSRMIGNNIYFISTKNVYYYDGIKDDEILPLARDTISSEEYKVIECTDIAYFKGTTNYNYMLVGGFNIENNEEVKIETFFGASEEIYASENNLYITQRDYGNGYSSLNLKTIIYKFNLDNSNVILQCKGEVEGEINNQFSMDEYDGNLRIATTYTIKDDTKEEKNEEDETVTITFDNDKIEANRLYILDKDLNEIGRIDNLAEGERIYSVRFIGKTGYIVTFEQIDPLFIIDLSNPTNPQVKGELKIPGYSSYLHPYDENHIIGIGYNTKDNGYGGITNDNMKMSMFDVSDLENPKEIFSTDIGDKNYYTYSDIIHNHKVLFYNKNKNLIGFPYTNRGNTYKDDKSGFVIFKIDLESGFEKYGEILNKVDYNKNITRIIYINDDLYTLSNSDIIEYDLNSFEKKKEVIFE